MCVKLGMKFLLVIYSRSLTGVHFLLCFIRGGSSGLLIPVLSEDAGTF